MYSFLLIPKKDIQGNSSIIAIIPAYNEEKNIGRVIQETKKYVSSIIVVDDGSNDNTFQIAKNMNVIAIRNEGNKGKSGALKVGFHKALKEVAEIFIILDADGQHNPEEIPLFLNKIRKGFDLVIGARKFNEAFMPKMRILANFISSYLVSWVCGFRVEDSQSGYRVLRREVLETIELTSNRFQIDTEMIIKSSKYGFKVGFIPIETIYHPEARSRVHQIIDPLKFIYLMVRLTFWRGK